MISETLTRAEQIARLNDRARQGLDRTALVNFTRACLAEFCSDDTPNGLLAQALPRRGDITGFDVETGQARGSELIRTGQR